MNQKIVRRLLVLAIATVALALPASASAVNPDMTWTSPSNNQFVGNTLVFSGSSSNVDIYLDYYLDGTDGPHVLTPDPSSPRSFSFNIDTSQLAEGPHTLQAHAFPLGAPADGSLGFANLPYTTFYVDHGVPSLTFSSPIADGASTATNDFEWTFSTNGAGFRCSIDGAPSQACSSPVSLIDLPDGEHSFSVFSRNSAGTFSQPQGVNFTVNSAWATPPETVFTSKPSTTESVVVATFAFESTTATTFECSLDGAAFAACTSPHTVTGMPTGEHTLSVRGTDPTGQVELTPETTTFNSPAPAQVPIGYPVPAPKVTGASGKAKKLSVTVSGPGTVAAKVEACAKKNGKTVCKSFTSGTATASAAGKLTLPLKKALKKKSKYRISFTSTSSTGAAAKSIAKIKAR